MYQPSEPRASTTNRSLTNVAAALFVAIGGMLLVATPASAQEPTASLSIQKVADATTVPPGQTFNYTIQVQCTTAVATGCVNAALTDPLPEFIEPNGLIVVTGTASDPLVDPGPPIAITFQDDLGNGDVGFEAREDLERIHLPGALRSCGLAKGWRPELVRARAAGSELRLPNLFARSVDSRG